MADEFILPEADDVIGAVGVVQSVYDDTLLEIGRRYGLGYEEMRVANPAVDVWLPGEGTTWEEWTDLTKQVAEATGVQYAISIDRTGHRFAGPAMSMGATLIDAEGNFTVDTPGFRAFAELLKSWHEEAITPSEVWLVGDSLNNCIDMHANHNAADDAISVNAPVEFCESCHRFAGVRMDCFGCHATTPGQQRRAAE